MSTPASRVRWAELRPDDFRARRDACPVVYLPLGLCEPHGHVAALGLDLIKAEYYCDEAARRFGGIVAPSQGYHIHECGFHAPWLAEVVGEENPLLAALPPHVMLHLFLYQLRAFAHAGFRTVIALSGHSGGSQHDLRLAGAAFQRRTGLQVVVNSDPELVAGSHVGDHAGKYEISQLMAIQPDLVDLALASRRDEPGSGGRLALGDDASQATAAHGHAINEAIIAALGGLVAGRSADPATPVRAPDYATTESIWDEVRTSCPAWRSVSPNPGQPSISPLSRWHGYDHCGGIIRPTSR